ncbi:MAG: RluA family pseudouridine synthase [Treponemataceae bacterium]|nr:RluA family pseudouridine synthase [Treponemataceae bacterium]
MDFLQYTAGIDDEGRRLDRVLRIFLKNSPMSKIYKYIRTGTIRVNGEKTDCNYRVKKNDEIRIPKVTDSIEGEKTQDAKAFIEIEDVFRNSFVRIINKPYGISVHGDERSLDVIVKSQFLPDEKSLSFNPGPLHRIDRHTTGLVVFSQNHKGALVFSELLRKHAVKKEYLAILCGKLKEKMLFEDMISTDWDSDQAPSLGKNGFHKVRITKQDGKKARTVVTPLSHGTYENLNVTLALVEIDTGRKHQIRCQCSSHGFPLLGDTAYGGKNPQSIDGHFMLHSWRMTFPSDNSIGLPESVTANIPEKLLFFIKNHLSQDEISNYNIISV